MSKRTCGPSSRAQSLDARGGSRPYGQRFAAVKSSARALTMTPDASAKCDFDADVFRALESCVRAGAKRADIVKFTRLLLQNSAGHPASTPRKTRTALVSVASCLLIFACLVDWCQLLSSSHARHLLNHLLPYCDWTDFYYQDCLVSNPLYERRRLAAEDCNSCETLTGDVDLGGTANVSREDVVDHHILADVPLMVPDAVRDWYIFGRPSPMLELASVFLAADPDGHLFPCSMNTSVKLRGDNPLRSLLGRVRKGTPKRWFAHWENCDKAAAKLVRNVTGRLYFLPAMVDATDPNWVLLSVNYTFPDYKEISPVSDVVWVSLLHGQRMSFELSPRSPCNSTCAALRATLGPGESLLFTDRMWRFRYKFGDFGFHMAIAGGGTCEM